MIIINNSRGLAKYQVGLPHIQIQYELCALSYETHSKGRSYPTQILCQRCSGCFPLLGWRTVSNFPVFGSPSGIPDSSSCCLDFTYRISQGSVSARRFIKRKQEGEGTRQRTCMNDPQTWTTVWELTVGTAVGRRRAKGGNWDNCNRITIKNN